MIVFVIDIQENLYGSENCGVEKTEIPLLAARLDAIRYAAPSYSFFYHF